MCVCVGGGSVWLGTRVQLHRALKFHNQVKREKVLSCHVAVKVLGQEGSTSSVALKSVYITSASYKKNNQL